MTKKNLVVNLYYQIWEKKKLRPTEETKNTSHLATKPFGPYKRIC